MTNVIPLFSAARQRMNEAWVKFRDQREKAESSDDLTAALAELNEAIAEAHEAGLQPRFSIGGAQP